MTVNCVICALIGESATFQRCHFVRRSPGGRHVPVDDPSCQPSCLHHHRNMGCVSNLCKIINVCLSEYLNVFKEHQTTTFESVFEGF